MPGLRRNAGATTVPVIRIPFVISSNGIGDSLFKTVELWVFCIIAIIVLVGLYFVFSVISGLLKGEIPLPRMKITVGRMIAAFLIAAAGVAAFILNPLLLLPLLAVVLAGLVYLEMNGMNPDRGSAYNEQDPVARERHYRPGKDDGPVINAEFRVIEEPVKKEKQPRPVIAASVHDAAAQKKAEEQRTLYEEQKKRELEQKLRARERERLQYIHGLSAGMHREYLQEAERFRKEFGKNVQCDVCGRWDEELFVHRSQTYCTQCLPGGSRPAPDRGVVAGKHGGSIDYIKK